MSKQPAATSQATEWTDNGRFSSSLFKGVLFQTQFAIQKCKEITGFGRKHA